MVRCAPTPPRGPPGDARPTHRSSRRSATRVTLRFAAASLQQFAPHPGRASVRCSYQGYLEQYLAEQLCNGIPSAPSTATQRSYAARRLRLTHTHGPSRIRPAIAVSADSARVLNLARVGRVARLSAWVISSGRGCGGQRPNVVRVPPDLNAPWQRRELDLLLQCRDEMAGVPSTTSGANGINWVAATDPRVRTAPLVGPRKRDRHLPVISATTSLGSPVAVASGIEAG